MNIHTKQYIWFINILILGLIVWLGVKLGMAILYQAMDDSARTTAPVIVAKDTTQRMEPLRKYEAIIKGNMFAPERKKQAAPISTGRPETKSAIIKKNSSLRLKGIVINLDPERSYAILENIRERKQDLYRPGDKIGEAELVKVSPGEVLIKENGETIKLVIEDSKSSSRSGRRSSKPKRSAKRTPQPTATGNQIARSVGGNNYIVSRELMTRDMSDLYKLMSQINVRPNMKDGKPYGFKITSLRSGSIFKQLGLRNNDVIVQINDVDIRQPEDLMGLYRQVQQLDTVKMQVFRGNRLIPFTYSLK